MWLCGNGQALHTAVQQCMARRPAEVGAPSKPIWSRIVAHARMGPSWCPKTVILMTGIASRENRLFRNDRALGTFYTVSVDAFRLL